MSDERTLRYQATFTKAGGVVAPSVCAQQHPAAGGGFGVMAQQRLRAGATVASVPRALFITAATCRSREHLDRESVPSPIAAICIHLARHRLRLIEKRLACVANSQPASPASVLDVRAAAGFSLSHIDLSAISESGVLHDDWIARLPAQYDNLVQFAPHLDWLSSSSPSTSALASDAEQSKRAWMDTAALFDMSSEAEQQLPAARAAKAGIIADALVSALGLPRRYAAKVAREILTWRALARRYVRYLYHSSAAAAATASADASASALPAVAFSPALAALLDQHRASLSSAAAKNERAACAALHFASPDAVLVELFGWAYSSLMSRGFSHSDEVWLMQPWVDYFNYAPYADYNTSTSMNDAIGRFEFKVRTGKVVGAGQEVTLHYGTYSDFELALWYGFVLCRLGPRSRAVEEDDGDADGAASASSSAVKQLRRDRDDDGAEGDNENKDAELDSAWHQPECEYVLSPLSDSDGEYSAREFGEFVAEIVRIAVAMTSSGVSSSEAAAASQQEQQALVDQCTRAVAAKLCRHHGSKSPRCAIHRSESSFEMKGALEALFDEVVDFLENRTPAAGGENRVASLTTERLFAKVVAVERATAFTPVSTNGDSAAPRQALIQMMCENETAAARFARHCGTDVRSILDGAGARQ